MNRNDLYALGDVYGNLLNQVGVVEEGTGPGDKDLNKGAELKDGGPQEKGGFSKKRVDPDTAEEDNEFNVKKFSYPDDEECSEEDEEIMVEAVQHVLNCYSESAQPDDDIIGMIVEMGKVSIPNLRTVIHNLNNTNKIATVNLLTTVTENQDKPLYQECKEILKRVIQYDNNQKQPINEKRGGTALNNSSMKKNSFDKLFEAVMDGDYDELDELGVDTNDEFGELGSDLEAEDEDLGGEEVTVTLDRATAQALVDVLQGALEGGEIEDVDDLEGDVEGLESDVENFDEDEERVAGGVAKGEGIPAEAGVPKQHSANIDYGKKNQRGNLRPGSAAGAKGEGIPAAAGVPKQFSKTVNMGKQNKVGKLVPGKRMFD